ncbi:MAG TPA: penicillin-binding protein 2 [Pyrinomonadaceae bacterium]|nr:penicillin-binding protein 2 [Pyrinomonadaceae bacterium]HMP67069.1 penicillin-binding protein 2 [Pyrinomonadaceae bacterium]
MSIKPRARKKRDLKQAAFTRFMVIVSILILWIGGVGARLVYLQVTQYEELRKKAVGQRRDIKQTKLPRGTIFDRNERALALSVQVKTLYADATKIEDIKETARILSRALKQNESELRKRLSDAKAVDRKYVPIAKGIDSAEADSLNRLLEQPEVKKADLPRYQGLHWRDEQKRSYPQGSLAAHVIGFSNADGNGQAGIEQSQNDNLYGAVIRKQQQRDRLGRVYDETVAEKEPPKDVVLTIDTTAQFFTEQALEKAVKQSNARAGMAVLISNRTGEVLAMANYPTFDPNRLDGITSDNLANGVVQSIYSPGSVFKLITYGAALERRLVSPDAEIDAGSGTIEIGKRRFRDSRGYGRISYSKAMAVSSNVCAIKTSMRVGKEGFHRTILDFGFGQQTGVGLPAEVSGIVRPPERWYGDSMASMSIGYEIGVSVLQMATAFATIANDGVRIQPHVIKELRQQDGTIVSVTRPERTRVVSVETARGLRRMLREVVVSGTGKRAQVAGYTTAGKTGTAWKFDEKLKRVNSAKYVSSFIGFAPAEDPEVTIAVVIDEPKVGGRDGGSVAAPVFREIAEQLLPEMKISRDPGVFVMGDDPDDLPLLEAVGNGEELFSIAETERGGENGEDAAPDGDRLKRPANDKPAPTAREPVAAAKPPGRMRPLPGVEKRPPTAGPTRKSGTEKSN